jgi:hypothetical protein
VLRKQRRRLKNLRTHIIKAGTIIYRSSQSDCASCPLKARCCPNTPMRKIARSVPRPAICDHAQRNLNHIEYFKCIGHNRSLVRGPQSKRPARMHAQADFVDTPVEVCKTPPLFAKRRVPSPQSLQTFREFLPH